ncbi:MAG: hypothetical protein JNL69_04265 [Bacteroidia bacterium]|nr:hypothetical protein [Bacteroidia bacterium]
MEHYLINQKKIAIEKNKEFLFKIPVRLNLTSSTIVVENANKSLADDIVVTFLFKNLKPEEENEHVTLATNSFSRSFSIRPDKNTAKGEFLLYACAANKNVNIEVSILTN